MLVLSFHLCFGLDARVLDVEEGVLGVAAFFGVEKGAIIEEVEIVEGCRIFSFIVYYISSERIDEFLIDSICAVSVLFDFRAGVSLIH